jgi:hypothetical protein
VLCGTTMLTKRARVATPVSWFLALLSISSCLRIESTNPDHTDPPPDAFVRGTSLDGPVTCGSMVCPARSLCTHWSSGIDAGVPDDGGSYGENLTCSSVPASCPVQDCDEFTQRCSPCIDALCSSTGYGYGVSVIGRDLYCPGV